MKIMADMDAVHLGLDENEADIAEELQHFDDSFDTRSEASSDSDSSDSQPSISSVGSANSSESKNKRKNKTKKQEKSKGTSDLKAAKRSVSPSKESTLNGKSPLKKRKDSHSKSGDEPKDFIGPIKPDSVGNSSKKSRKKSVDGAQNVSTGSANVSGSVKSDVSDDESAKPKTTAAAYDSDSESENSDSAANIKRNGRKNASKNSTPEKRTSSSRSGAKGVSSYDYKTKLNYLFRDTRFFLIKSNNADNVTISKSKNVWATLPQNDANLTQAFKESRNVLLIFSVNESGKFAGFARMSACSSRDIPQPDWVLPSSISAKALGGVIEIDWICRKELSFNCTSHLYNSWNEGKPVKIGRDGQEIEPKVGAELCRLFPEDEKIELTPILRKSKSTAKMMREKGIRMVYKPPKSLSSRGGGGRGNSFRSGGGGDRNRDGGGPMRHKRFGGSHRPYKLPYMGHPGSYKRGGSPYRAGPGGGASGNGPNRVGGGDMPPWERYMTPTAAAEAYLVDYMRTMHGQLPPLPFVPPFGQLPPPTPGPPFSQIPPPTPGGTSVPPPGLPASLYEFPGRYYDGPPLPDYPPPQPARPPPPCYDKSAPSFEDFVNASSATAATTNATTSTTAGPNSTYRINRTSDMNNVNANRTRERPGRGNDYHRGGSNAGGSSRMASGGPDRDRNMRSGGVSERSSGRYNRGSRR
ncbi:YTH domain containing 1 [Haematobia irritans]|uniref:YTH domain containing 1 n=1 Tax=Haematobia irritans TaxID=7368 RepID=UPI003F4F9234